MTEMETKKIMAALWVAYPGFYAKVERSDQQAAVDLWQKCFAAEPYALVSAAVYALIKTRPNSYPPAIGEVTAKIQQLTAVNELTALEAWDLVAKALRNSAYGSDEEFAKLPLAVQRVVHSPSQLREWSLMDFDTVQSVVASNFQRAYTARRKNDREMECLPPVAQQLIKGFAEQIKGLPPIDQESARSD